MTRPFETLTFDNVQVFFAASDRPAAERVGAAGERSARLIHKLWGLALPSDVRLYVMTSWTAPMFHAAPWPRKLLLGLTLPFWGWRARRSWPTAGGWAVSFGQRQMIGVKPPHLIQTSDTSIGARVFISEPDVARKVEQTTCHELTHAATAHLKLPSWLNEGLAMVTVDRFAGYATVQPGTISALAYAMETLRLRQYPHDQDTLVHLYTRGYWLTRYFEETQPGLLRNLLTQRRSPIKMENHIAAAYGKDRGTFWSHLGKTVAAYFEQGE